MLSVTNTLTAQTATHKLPKSFHITRQDDFMYPPLKLVVLGSLCFPAALMLYGLRNALEHVPIIPIILTVLTLVALLLGVNFVLAGLRMHFNPKGD